MIALTVLVCAVAAFIMGWALGSRLKQSRTVLNHFSMARLLEHLVKQDEHLPILPPGERENAADLLNEFWKRPPEIDYRDLPRKPRY